MKEDEEIELDEVTEQILNYQDRIITLSTLITSGVCMHRNGELQFEYALSKKNREEVEKLILILAKQMILI